MGREIVSAEENLQQRYNDSVSSYPQTPMLALNHVSFVCTSLSRSIRFYVDVLGFILIKRPSSFDFEGAWLFNYGVGIHLLEVENVPVKKGKINPKDNHISFQCYDMKRLIRKLENMKIEYVTAVVEDGGIMVDQLFFHDPDGYMIEICNCENLPVLPLSSCPLKLSSPNNRSTVPSTSYVDRSSDIQCSIEVARTAMLDNLISNMMDISI
ncbi:hypothetical protein SAY87_020691 [Trapa incisa]|uniref:VOC domain-containing protein n=1 Tax=Trapa incisa TaxID=236973 RepID=A0AAN7PQ36_9MYRT|nr:hypothetical protein SAY87_020691 [Trapa incisa]